MIHRLALRVVPRLALAVTADSVRKRKRWVMLASGLVAFLIYRLLKLVDPLSDPLILLAVSGLLSVCMGSGVARARVRSGTKTECEG